MFGKACGFETCDRPATSRGLCSGHYAQQRRGTELKPLKHYIAQGVNSKACSKCKVEKPLDQYWKRTSGTLQSTCKSCVREQQRNWYQAKMRKAALWDAQQAQGATNKLTVDTDTETIKGESQ